MSTLSQEQRLTRNQAKQLQNLVSGLQDMAVSKAPPTTKTRTTKAPIKSTQPEPSIDEVKATPSQEDPVEVSCTCGVNEVDHCEIDYT